MEPETLTWIESSWFLGAVILKEVNLDPYLEPLSKDPEWPDFRLAEDAEKYGRASTVNCSIIVFSSTSATEAEDMKNSAQRQMNQALQAYKEDIQEAEEWKGG